MQSRPLLVHSSRPPKQPERRAACLNSSAFTPEPRTSPTSPESAAVAARQQIVEGRAGLEIGHALGPAQAGQLALHSDAAPITCCTG